MMAYCKMRIFEWLPGLVDIRVISADNGTSLYDNDYLISVPICYLKEASDDQISSINQLIEA